MTKLFIVPIEKIETRYTLHWYNYLPELIRRNTNFDEVIQLESLLEAPKNTDGGFFNFNFTCEYKASQVELVSALIKNGSISNGDVILYTDYWNPGVHMTRYMLDLNSLYDVKLVGIAHAGDWDPADILHQKLMNKRWSKSLELSYDEVYDHILFATDFSKALYSSNLVANDTKHHATGFPMEYYDDVMPCYWDLENPPAKENLVIFPHRISSEKNHELFKILEKKMPEYKFVVALDVCKNKDDYHNLMYRGKCCFSAALQETLGISMGIEALRAGCNPVVPNRLSYAEVFDGWTHMFPGSMANEVIIDPNHPDIDFLVAYIRNAVDSWNIDFIEEQHDRNYSRFFTGTRMYQFLDTLR